MTELALGLDVGGTKLAGVLLSREGQIIAKKAVHTRANEGGEAVVTQLCGLTEDLLHSTVGTIVGIGLATPGIVDSRTGQIHFVSTKLPGWAELPIVQTIARCFALPVKADNDGRAAAVAEHRFGSGQELSDFVTIVIGTGIGGGIIANNQLLSGSLGGAGRLGHLSVDPNGPACTCGNRGCLERYLSGQAFVAAAEEAIASRKTGSYPGQPGPVLSLPLSGREVVEASLRGDPWATEIVGTGGRRLGQALVQIARILDPERVAIGGSIATAGDLLLGPARDYLAQHSPARLEQTLEVVEAHFGRDASVVGAAIMGWQAAQS